MNEAATANGPTRVGGRFRDAVGYVVVFAVVLALYLATMAPGPLWQDNGMAQIRVLQRDFRGGLGLALSHPLYYAIGFAFQRLPFGEPAFRVNLVAVLFGAVTVANVYLLLRRLAGRDEPALIGAASLAVAHTFWQQSVTAEVYSVSSALMTGELLCLLQYCRTSRPRWLAGLLLLNGLGISNHMLASLSFACYVVFALAELRRGRLAWRWVPWLVGAWLLGAGIYLGMIVEALAGGAGVAETLRSALFGTSYAGNVLNVRLSAGLLWRTVLYLGLNFPTPVALLVVVGLGGLTRMASRAFGVVLCSLTAVHLVWAMRYNVPDQYTFFFLSVVLLAIWLGLGADRFLVPAAAWRRYAVLAGVLLPVLVYALLPRAARSSGVSLGLGRHMPFRDEYAYFLLPWKTGYREPEQFARRLCDNLPANSVIVADGTTVSPLHYVQLLGRWRDDVRICPPLDRSSAARAACGEAALQVSLAAGRVYVVTPSPGYCPKWLLDRWEFEPAGIVHRAARPKADNPPR